MENNEIEFNKQIYVLKSSIKNTVPAIKKKGLKYVIVRTYSAGVFAGYLVKRTGKEVQLTEARRLWYWKGANSLSELAKSGVKYPAECKFSVPVNQEVTECIEILEVSEKARLSIASVKEWEQ